jgi:hypothetical protein
MSAPITTGQPADPAGQAPESFAAVLGGSLARSQADLLHAQFSAAREIAYVLLCGETRADDETAVAELGGKTLRQAMSGLWDELHEVCRDLTEAMGIATLREIGAERVARAERRNHLDEIARAERLLAAERAA